MFGWALPGERGHPAREHVVRDVRVHQGDAGIVERHIDELALARARPLHQRHQQRDRGVKARAEVHERNADPGRPAIFLRIRRHAVDREHADHRLDHGVVAGHAAHRTIGAEPADPAMDQSRKALLQHVLVAEAPLLHRAGLVVLDQDVGALEQAEQHVAPRGLGQIETERALVAIDADEVGRIARLVERRAPVACLVALGRLDLEHLAAVVAEDLGAVRTAQDARQVDDPNPAQRSLVRHFRRPSP